MGVFDIDPGQNPQAFGTVSYGVEGSSPGFQVDTNGNLTITGAFRANNSIGGQPVIDISKGPYNADPHGIVDASNAIDAAAAACMTSGDPTSTTRVGIYPLYIPYGDFKVTRELEGIRSVRGFNMFGQGSGSRLVVSGTGLASVLNLMGVAYSEFRDFEFAGATASDSVTSALALDWDPALASRSSTQNTFRHVNVRDLKYVNGLAFGRNSGSRQVDQLLVEQCEAYGGWTAGETTWWQNGFLSGSGTHGNALNHDYKSCVANFNRYNLYANACPAYWIGGAVSFAEADFRQSGVYPLSIQGFRSEHSTRLLKQSGGAGFLSTVSIRDVFFDGSSVDPDGRVVYMGYPGDLTVDNLWIQESVTNPSIYFESGQSRTLKVTARNLRGRSTVDAYFASNSAVTAPLDVSCDGYQQTDEFGDPVLLSGMRTGSPQFLTNQGSAPATPTGGGFLYTSAGALKYKGSGGTVTTIAPA